MLTASLDHALEKLTASILQDIKYLEVATGRGIPKDLKKSILQRLQDALDVLRLDLKVLLVPATRDMTDAQVVAQDRWPGWNTVPKQLSNFVGYDIWVSGEHLGFVGSQKITLSSDPYYLTFVSKVDKEGKINGKTIAQKYSTLTAIFAHQDKPTSEKALRRKYARAVIVALRNTKPYRDYSKSEVKKLRVEFADHI